MTRIEQPELNPKKPEPIQRVAAKLSMPILDVLHAMEGLPISTLRVLAGVDNPKIEGSSIKPNNPAVVSPKV